MYFSPLYLSLLFNSRELVFVAGGNSQVECSFKVLRAHVYVVHDNVCRVN